METRILISPDMMQQHESAGTATLLGHIGIFNRPVYAYDGQVWRQYMRFNRKAEEWLPGEFYNVLPCTGEWLMTILIPKGENNGVQRV